MKPLATLAALLLAVPVALCAAQMPDYARAHAVAEPAKDDKAKTDDADADTPADWLAAGAFALDLGRYKTARAEYRKVLKAEPANQQAARGLSDALAAEGEYKDAATALEKVMAQAGSATERTTLARLGRLRLTLGDYPGAQECADTLFKADANDIDGILLAGRVLYDKGQYEEAAKTLGRARDVAKANVGNTWTVGAGKGRQADLADLLCSAGECLYMLSLCRDDTRNDLGLANDCWNIAVRADPYHVRTNAWMARLIFDQPVKDAANSHAVVDTLGHNPYAADIHFWLACAHFASWRSGAGLASLDQCLKIAPDHHLALAFRAQRMMYMDDYEAGKRDYERALKLNPNNLEALGAKGLHGKTLGLDGVFNEAEKAALSINPKPARFYEVIADGLSDRFRYFEALPLYARAIDCNPMHWTAYKGRGMAAMNKGDDVLGRESLEKAFQHDPLRNNLQTGNLLTLLGSYKNFQRVETTDGRWRLLVHKSESKLMVDFYMEQLNTAWDRLERKYNFKPRIPLTIEAFHRHEDFEVRTVGIKGLPALGACFGQLITLDSPSARPVGSYNWASTLRHELDHVWQIQISNGQVPRWLAEGLSVYEEKTTRPEWERHMEDQLFQRYHMDDIPPVKKFNEWFRDGSKILFAYYLGNVMLEFIDKKLGGMGAVRKMLEMFGLKKTPEEVFRACLGIEPEVFDKKFRDYVRDERISHLRMVKRVSDKRIDELFYAYEDGNATRAQLVELALGYTQQGKDVDAALFLGMSQKQGAETAEGEEGALWNYAKAALSARDQNVPAPQRAQLRRKYIEVALQKGLQDFGTYMFMVGVARTESNNEAVMKWLDAAHGAFPETPQPLALKYQIYLAAEDKEKAIECAEAWMRLDENNLAIRQWLMENAYVPKRQWDKLADMALQALYIAPLDPAVHSQRGEALRRLKKYDDAVKHFEFVFKLAAGTPEEIKKAQASALLDIAATWLQADDKDKCRKALEEARKLEPENTRIKTIEGELDGGDEDE